MFKRILILSSLLVSLISLPAFSATWVVADFNSGTTPFNIDAGSSVGTDPDYYNWFFVSTVTHGNTGNSFQINRSSWTEPNANSYLIFNFGALKDLTQYKALSFWIKGAAGGEHVRISLEGTAGAPGLRPDISGFLPTGVTTDWQKIVIPLSALLQGVSPSGISSVQQLVFTIDNTTTAGQTFYIDDMEFHTKCAPVYVDHYESSSGDGALGRAIGGGADTSASWSYVSNTAYQSSQSLAFTYQISGSGWGAVLEERFGEDSTNLSMPLDVSSCDNLEIALRRGDTTGASLNPLVELWASNGTVGHSAQQAIDTNFQLFTIPIASLDTNYAVDGATHTKMMKLYFTGLASNATCYVDQVRFVNHSTPTAPTVFLQNGQAITDGFTISTTSILQVTAQSEGANSLMEHVRFEHDGLSGGQTWYTIGKETDTADGIYTFNWNAASLPSGTTYQIRAVAENINGNYAFLKLNNCIRNSAPADITDLTAVGAGVDGSVRLTWTAPGDNGVSGALNGVYLIKAATSYISTTAFDLIPNINPAAFSIQFATTSVTPFEHQSYVLTGLFPGSTFFFAITASDAANNWSVWQGTSASVNPLSFAAAPDLTPNAVTALTAAQGSSLITLSWTNPAPPPYINDYSEYRVYTATTSFNESQLNDPYISVMPVTYLPLQDPVTAHMLNLENYVTYFFHVSLFDLASQSGLFSIALSSYSTVEASTMTVLMLPTAPAGFTGTAVSTSSINWSWADTNDEGYRVKYASSPLINASTDQAQNTVSWLETALTANTPYGRCAAAFNESGESPLSNSATVYTLADVPSGLSVSDVAISSAALAWTANNPNGTRFGVSYSTINYYVNVTTAVRFADNLTTNATNMLYLSQATTYYFRVWAYNNDQRESLSSVQISTKTKGSPAPTGFSGNVLGTTSINWSWDALADVDGFRVKVASEPSTAVSGNLSSVSWDETGLSPNVACGRAVVSYTGEIESSLSNSAAKYTFANPPLSAQPSNVLASSLFLTWSANNNPSHTRYGVSYSSVTSADSFWLISYSTPVNYSSNNTAASAALSSLAKATTYYIRIWAYNGDQVITTYTETSTCTLTSVDTTKPVITTHTVISDIYALGKDIPIKATVTDDELVSGATLNYMIGAGAWVPLAMTVDSGATSTSKQFSGAIPGSEITAYGEIIYYISATDALYNISSTTIHTIAVSQVASQTISSGTVSLQDANPDDGVVSVTIPEGALKTRVAITIEPLDTALITLPPAASETARPASAYDFGPSGTSFKKPVTLTLLYTDLNPKDGIEDNLQVAVKNLRVFFWDGIEWRLVGGTVNDFSTTDVTKVNTVTVPTMHFSRYALFPVKAGAVNYKPKEKIITPASKDGFNDFAQFDGLSGEDVKIEIYDIEARKVRTINVIKEGNTWNGIDDDGYLVESGVYIFQFKFQDKLYSGTIIVAK